jgi:hypothetical protein
MGLLGPTTTISMFFSITNALIASKSVTAIATLVAISFQHFLEP